MKDGMQYEKLNIIHSLLTHKSKSLLFYFLSFKELVYNVLLQRPGSAVNFRNYSIIKYDILQYDHEECHCSRSILE